MDEIKAYDYHVAETIVTKLFYDGKDREDGLKEIPAASLQLLVSALEAIRWDVFGEDREAILRACGIAERLRDEQKLREWKRREES